MSTSKTQDAVNPLATPNRLNVAKALATAYKAIDDQSNIVAQVCNSAEAVFKGATIEKHDMNAILSKVAELRKWSDASKRSRSSEIRAVLRVYDQLPKAIKAYREKSGSDRFQWHDAIKLARHVKSLDSIDDAVKEMLCKDDSEPTPAKVKKVRIPADALKSYDHAIELAKSEFGTSEEDQAHAAIIKWYVECHEVAKAA